MNQPEYKPSWRKPAGMAIMLAIIAGWAFLIASCADAIGTLPVAAQILLYAFAGIIWIAPMKSLLQWMETGRWRA